MLTEVTPIYRRKDETDNRTWFIWFIFLEAARWSTCLAFKISSHYVLQAGLELMVLLKRWDYREHHRMWDGSGLGQES